MKKILLLFFLFPVLAFSQIVYVTPTGAGTNNGSSWSNAYSGTQLQTALNNVAAGGEVWVAAGTYLPTYQTEGGDVRTKTFYINRNIKVYGGFPATGSPTMADRNPAAHVTTLSGDIDGAGNNDSYHVVYLYRLSSSALLDGFTLSGSNANGAANIKQIGGGIYNDGSGAGNSSNPAIANCTFENCYAAGGAGILNDGRIGGECNPTITQCSFKDNTATLGGGIYNVSDAGGKSNPTITQCTFTNNVVEALGGGILNVSGGNNSQSSPTITQCTFTNNQAVKASVYNAGGAIGNQAHTNGTVNPLIENCTFTNNTAQYSGGAIWNYSNLNGGGTCSPTIRNCSFVGNAAQTHVGGAIFNSANEISGSGTGFVQPSIENCLFRNNTAVFGGAVYNYSAYAVCKPKFRNCTFVNNSATNFGGTLGNNTDLGTIEVEVKNSIFWGNSGTAKNISIQTVTAFNISHSLLDEAACPANVTCGAGMIYNQNPLFVNQGSGDLRLQLCSPAINVGDNTGVSGTDLDNNPRIALTTVDLGAYEFQANTTTVIAATVTGNSPSTCSGTNGTIVLSALSPNVTYSVSYKKDMMTVAAADFTANAGGVITLSNLTKGSYTDIVATYGRCSSTPASVTLLDPTPPMATIVNDNGPLCAGGNASFTINGTGGATLTYTLMGNQTLLLNGSNQTIFANNVSTNVTLTLVNVTKNDCPVMLSATSTVTVYPLPTDVALSGGGISFCGTPMTISTAGSQSGVSYQLKRNNVNLGSPLSGTGNPLSFSGLTQAGNYTVVATSSVGNCPRTLSTEITIQTRNAPTAYNLSGGGASCSGTPVSIHLSNSQIGVLYQLKRGNNPVGNPVPGTGSALSFQPQNTAGNYTAVALTQCADLAMNNTVSVTNVVTPSSFTVTGGGISCGTALPVGLNDSQSGVFYQLLRNNAPVGTTVQGTGNAITLGNHLTAGQYTIVATRAGECPTTMSGSVLIDLIDPPTLFNLSAGGPACPGGVPINLSGSQSGIEYQLKRGNTLVISQQGDGNPLAFPNQTVAGNYTVEAVSEGNCTRTMGGAAIVTSAGTLPNAYTMTGGGMYCNSVTLALGLSDSQKSVSYQLQRNTPSGFVNVGTSVQGTGSALALGTHSVIGEYRVVVNSACLTEMASRKFITACSPRAAVDGSVEQATFAQVRPNPVANIMHLNINEANGQKVNVNLVDASGRTLLQRDFIPQTHQHQEEFEVSHLANGMYFLRVTTAHKQATLKVVKVQ